MAYAYKPIKVTVSGEAFNGAEIWSTGFFLGFENQDAGDVTAPMAASIAAKWKLFFENPLSNVHSYYTTKQVKLARFSADMRTELDQVEYFNYGTAIVGGATGNTAHPPQTTLVGTLISSNVRGVAAKGRMYLPGICATLGPDAKIDAGILGAIADKFNDFLSQINEDPDIAGRVVLVSPGRKNDLIKAPQNKLVEHVRMGDVYDTQRRRRNGISETYLNRDTSQG